MSPLKNLLESFAVEETDNDEFLAPTVPENRQRVFGGLVVAQACISAMLTVSDKHLHSLHSYFLLPGDPKEPIKYKVTRLRDGKSFSTRHCTAHQGSRTIFSMMCSFQREEGGFAHETPMPDVPAPELIKFPEVISGLKPEMAHALKTYLNGERPFEIKPVDLEGFLNIRNSANNVGPECIWLRANGTLPDNKNIHLALLAYLSDLTLINCALKQHSTSIFDRKLQVASLDHSIWFHKPTPIDGWLLYVQDSPWAGGARGLSRGQIFSQDGCLIATTAQEGLIRTHY